VECDWTKLCTVCRCVGDSIGACLPACGPSQVEGGEKLRMTVCGNKQRRRKEKLFFAMAGHNATALLDVKAREPKVKELWAHSLRKLLHAMEIQKALAPDAVVGSEGEVMQATLNSSSRKALAVKGEQSAPHAKMQRALAESYKTGAQTQKVKGNGGKRGRSSSPSAQTAAEGTPSPSPVLLRIGKQYRTRVAGLEARSAVELDSDLLSTLEAGELLTALEQGFAKSGVSAMTSRMKTEYGWLSFVPAELLAESTAVAPQDRAPAQTTVTMVWLV
jgi:hypothetical protein